MDALLAQTPLPLEKVWPLLQEYCAENCSISACVLFDHMFITPINVSLSPHAQISNPSSNDHFDGNQQIFTEEDREINTMSWLRKYCCSHSLGTHICLPSKTVGQKSSPSKHPFLLWKDCTITKNSAGVWGESLWRLFLCLSWECCLGHFPPFWEVKFPHLSRDHYSQLVHLCAGFHENRTAI